MIEERYFLLKKKHLSKKLHKICKNLSGNTLPCTFLLPASPDPYLAAVICQPKHLSVVDVNKPLLSGWLETMDLSFPCWTAFSVAEELRLGRHQHLVTTHSHPELSKAPSHPSPAHTLTQKFWCSQQGDNQKPCTSAQWPCYSWISDLFFFPPSPSENTQVAGHGYAP